MTKKTIYINGKFLTTQLSGVQRVAFELVVALDEQLAIEKSTNENIEIILIYSGKIINPISLRFIKLKKQGIFKGVLWEQVELPLYAGYNLLVSLCSIGPLIKRNQVIMIHDASFFINRHFFSKAFGAWYRFAIPWLGKFCRKILTVSNFSKEELQKYAGIKPEKIIVIYNSATHILRFGEADERFVKQIRELKPYCLAVSNVALNKNFAGLNSAISKIDFKPYNMVIAGGGLSSLSDGRTDGDAIYLGYVNDRNLRYLYENAALFIFPSFYEGFGIPPLEAMLLNCPAIVSDTSAMPEICADAVWYFDPFDPSDMANKINDLLRSPLELDRLKVVGKNRAECYSWEASAAKLYEVMLEICE